MENMEPNNDFTFLIILLSKLSGKFHLFVSAKYVYLINILEELNQNSILYPPFYSDLFKEIMHS